MQIPRSADVKQVKRELAVYNHIPSQRAAPGTLFAPLSALQMDRACTLTIVECCAHMALLVVAAEYSIKLPADLRMTMNKAKSDTSLYASFHAIPIPMHE